MNTLFPKINRKLLSNFDWIQFGLVLLVTTAGILTIYSATRPPIDSPHPTFYLRQVAWFAAGILVILLVTSIDYRWIHRASYVLHGIGVFLLFLVPVFGTRGLGAQRWLSLGFMAFQPSELAKFFFLTALARHLAQLHGPMSLKDLARAFLIFLLPPLALLLIQPDLGTALMFVFIFTGLVLVFGLRKRVLIALTLSILLAVPFLGSVAWSNLKPYQKNRIIAFLEPEVDPAGIGYQINQSKITIGSGGLLGKGFLKGTQGSLRFLPEKHTDFIFAIFAEEWGFVGAMVLLSVIALILLRGLETAQMAKDRFGYFLALGIVFMLGFYSIINVAMTLGLAPVVGVPLPFMSYGGTALLTNCLAIGLLISIRMRRFELFY